MEDWRFKMRFNSEFRAVEKEIKEGKVCANGKEMLRCGWELKGPEEEEASIAGISRFTDRNSLRGDEG